MRGRAGIRILALIGAVACAPQAAPAPVDTAADEAAVRAVRDAEVAAIAAGDASGGYLAADAVVLPPNEPALTGIDAIRPWFAQFMEMFPTAAVNYAQSDITVSGDWAIERYAGTLTMTPAGGGAATTEVLKGLHVYRREADGSWKMVYDIWNSDAAPPAAPSM